jgi:serine/threonine-protein kinase
LKPTLSPPPKTMSNGNWKKAKEVFGDALEVAPKNRAVFLDKACAEDESLRREVESLLSSHDSAESFMETPAVAKVAGMIEAETKHLEGGQSLGHYEIIEQIGEGGMGEVYLAKDARLNRQVAVKLLAAHITEDENRVSRFRQEALATSALNHPNILTIYEVGEWQGRDFIASEYVEGITLRSLLGEKERSVSEALDIALQIAGALSEAHGAGIVHRDIKPENIIIRRDGLVKILDFGIAKYMPSGNGRRSLVETQVGEVIGTVAYMSPEQARGLEIDQRTDIWSLGVILYEMIAGELPFPGKTKSDRIAAILEHEPVPLTKVRRKVPRELERIMGRALAKNKKDRYREAADLAEDLRRLRETTGGKHPSSFALPGRKSAAPPRAYLYAASVLAVLLIVGVVAGYYFWPAGKLPSGADGKKSIAVLPLKPINTAGRDEIYEVGIADSLILKLSSIKGFIVRPLSATRKYADIGQDPLVAGREQQVDYVLASNYQLAGGKIRITAQLLNVANGQIEETYTIEKDAANVFAMQDAIAGEVGNKLSARFATTSSNATTKRGTTNEEAYRLYLQAMYLADIHTLSTARKAVEVLERAVEFDPDYAQAWAGKAYAHRGVANFIGRNVSNHEDYQKSMEAIKRALSLDENLAEAYSTLCENKMYYEYDFVEAESACKRGIELNPNSPLAHQVYSRYLMSRGRFDEAITEIKTTIDLEPASLFYNSLYGINLYYARRHPEAIAQFKRVIAMDENFAHPYFWLYAPLAAQGSELEAFEIFMKVQAKAFKPDEATVQAYRAAYQTSGWRGVMQELAKRYEQSNGRYWEGAIFNAQAGNKDKAFEYLEKSYQRREMWMAYLQVDPRLDPLRDDPRFDELVRRVGISQ